MEYHSNLSHLLALESVFKMCGQKDKTCTHIRQVPYDAGFFTVCKVNKTEAVLFVRFLPI